MTAFIELRGGPCVRAEAIALGCDLERRGVKLAVTADGKLTAAPRERLTADDITAIRAHKQHLLAILAYIHDGTDHAAHLRG